MRRTVAPADWTGIGAHSGRACSASVRPSPPDHGIRVNGHLAVASNVVSTSGSSTDMDTARTVEHLLAALAILEITDAAVYVEHEVPCLDGSASCFLEQLTPIDIPGECPAPVVLSTSLTLRTEGGSWVRVDPAQSLSLDVSIDFPEFGPQRASLAMGDSLQAASARTFVTERLLTSLHARGLALGITRETIPCVDDMGRWGLPLRMPDEPVMHKILDLIGDLSLLGRPLCGKITAFKPSHRLNLGLVRALTEFTKP